MGFFELVIIGILVLACVSVIGWGGVMLLLQLGVIAQKASEPPTRDQGGYTLEQGRDVGKPPQDDTDGR